MQMDQVKIELSIPRVVDEFWKSIGYTQEDYQSRFLDCLRAQIDAVASETPKAREVIKILEEESEKWGISYC